MLRRLPVVLLLALLGGLTACSPDDEPAPNNGGGAGPGAGGPAAAGALEGASMGRPAAATGLQQTWSQRELVRNGDFQQGALRFGLSGAGGGSGVSTDAGAQGDGRDQGLSLSGSRLTNVVQIAVQQLEMPDVLTAARLRLRYRVGAQGQAQFQQFDVGLGPMGTQNFEPVVQAVFHDMQRQPQAGWQQVDITLTPAQMKSLAGLRAQKRPALLWVRLIADNVTAHVDDLSLVVDGTRTLPAVPGVLSYAVQAPRKHTRIESVAPDGRGTTVHWRAPHPDTVVYGMSWSPDRKQLAFASDHEMAWSPWASDIYTLSSQGLRKLTNAPSHADIQVAGRPTGAVRVRVHNMSRAWLSDVSLGVQGGTLLVPVSIGPQATETFTVQGVADLGPGIPQMVYVRRGAQSSFQAVGVDVKAGETVDAGGTFSVLRLSDWRVTAPSWHPSGRWMAVGVAGLHTLVAEGGVPTRDHVGNLDGYSPRYAPNDGRLLYLGFGGAWMLPPEAQQAVKVAANPGGGLWSSPAWMPDGKSMLLVGPAQHPMLGIQSEGLWHVLRPGAEPAVRVQPYGEDVRHVAVSPDGAWLALTVGRAEGTYELSIRAMDNPAQHWRIPINGDVSHVVWGR